MSTKRNEAGMFHTGDQERATCHRDKSTAQHVWTYHKRLVSGPSWHSSDGYDGARPRNALFHPFHQISF